MLPHQHHDELTSDEHEVQHKEADSLLDYIKLVFHEDMGEGHLEHVIVGQFLSLDIDSDYVGSSDLHGDLRLQLAEKSEHNAHTFNDFAHIDYLPQLLTEESTSLRGPPSLI